MDGQIDRRFMREFVAVLSRQQLHVLFWEIIMAMEAMRTKTRATKAVKPAAIEASAAADDGRGKYRCTTCQQLFSRQRSLAQQPHVCDICQSGKSGGRGKK